MSRTITATAAPDVTHDDLIARYQQVRAMTGAICQPLVPEDYVVQSMPDVSPTKWHLAHTSWFFETFILVPHIPGYRVFNEHFAYLFNSYYVAIGDRHCRQNRGQLSRPTVAEVYDYRHYVDEQMLRWLDKLSEKDLRARLSLIELGLNHEQQHQELMLTDIKHVFWVNPMRPAYTPAAPREPVDVPPMKWIAYGEGVRWIGHDGEGFAFDNESPRHRVFVEAFKLASRLVTNGEYKRFIDAGGYRRPELWLSAGWATVQEQQWHAPLYWIEQEGRWINHTLAGLRDVADDEPVCHVSYFEADAYARWAGARLPTEFEWESAAQDLPLDGPFLESRTFHPFSGGPGGAAYVPSDPPAPSQMFGLLWQWTRSQYSPYPGYAPAAGALGEYNGKFMCNQFVLRGGSVATPRSHIRRTYRNFFAPDARWQFSGIRLASDV